LCQADPVEGRIDEGQQLAARAAVLILNAASDALDMARKHPRVADQFHGRVFADTDATKFGFLEIALHPKSVGIDQREDGCADVDLAPGQEIEIFQSALISSQDLAAV
jgi:hypothetical protein